MFILGIGGSPKHGGFTDSLLDKALDGARSTGAKVEKIILNDLEYLSCQDCGGCDNTGVCVIKDGMSQVYRKVRSANGLIVASPIYFGSVTAQLKSMIDRFQSAWVAKFVLKRKPGGSRGRKGIFISSAGEEKRRYFTNAREIVRVFFASVGIKYTAELFIGGYNRISCDEKARKRAMDKAFKAGVMLAESVR